MADGWRQGYWRNDDGALIVTAGAGAAWVNGYRRHATNALGVTLNSSGGFNDRGHFVNAGFPLVYKVPGTGPVWDRGFLRAADGALSCVAYPAAGQKMDRGFLRDPNGALVVVVV